MSKLYDRYETLKEDNENLIYLFECGNFYIALDSDAIVLNELFDLKLTKFSNLCDKCGFPKNAIDKYKELLNNKKIEYKIIEQTNISSDKMVQTISTLINNIEIENKGKDELIVLIKQIKNIIEN